MTEAQADLLPWKARGSLVFFPGGGFDVRNCPEPEKLATAICEAMNRAPSPSREAELREALHEIRLHAADGRANASANSDASRFDKIETLADDALDDALAGSAPVPAESLLREPTTECPVKGCFCTDRCMAPKPGWCRDTVKRDQLAYRLDGTGRERDHG